MSTLTKVFVVVLVVCSIAFTTMTISTVAQTANWHDTAIKYEQNARVADTTLRQMIAASAAEDAAVRDANKGLSERIGQLEADLQKLGTESAQMKADLAKADSEKSSSEAMNRGLLASLQMAEASRQEYRKQRDDIEKGNIELQQRNIDLSGRVNELTAKVSVLMEQKRQYEQQLNILKTENERVATETQRPSVAGGMENPNGVMPNIKALTPVSATPIRGKVMEVTGDSVSLSVGSSDGVQKDMVFVVHRNGDYVADVKIVSVEPNRSAGKVIKKASGPQPSDQITDALSLSSTK
ncbi:MAG: hypothetical protein HY287_00765 [Planctomycetes bacterium]|nr:hypothetical protein [Planctomycetota bacterium]MBI3832840.1 hypothetical protein [Planctomycetota bacterium]